MDWTIGRTGLHTMTCAVWGPTKQCDCESGAYAVQGAFWQSECIAHRLPLFGCAECALLDEIPVNLTPNLESERTES